MRSRVCLGGALPVSGKRARVADSKDHFARLTAARLAGHAVQGGGEPDDVVDRPGHDSSRRRQGRLSHEGRALDGQWHRCCARRFVRVAHRPNEFGTADPDRGSDETRAYVVATGLSNPCALS